jgi:alpha-glucoside transport system permease protein
MSMDRLITALIVLIGVPAVLVGYILIVEQVLKVLPGRTGDRLRPWFWLLPAIALLVVFLVYPTINTIVLSFMDRFSREFVGWANYDYVLTTSGTLDAIKNSILWLVFLTAGTLVFGLVIAILVDRVRYESLAKSVIFVPLSISFVAAGIIWLFMYAYRPPGEAQTGTINAFLGLFGFGPVPWIIEQPINNFALIGVGVWMWTGFAMVILSAGLKGISTELLEAARVDGATEWQVFRRIILPLLTPTIFVVGTTMVITALKSFDIVYTMTNGNFDTDVIARRMYAEMFNFGQFGRASAIAVVLLVAIIPFMAINIRNFRRQEASR